jgi:hypothetical protein
LLIKHPVKGVHAVGPARLPATTAAAVVALLMLWLVPAQSAAAKHNGLKIDILSTRADLISGGEALVAIRGAHSLRGLKVKAAGKSQTKRFQLVDGTPEGVVKGLARGRSSIVVRQGRKGARLRVTNHPSGGPVFSGPQLKPWRCQEGATDSKCDQPPTYSYLYMPTNGSSLQPYDRNDPPSDVATTTTDQGVKVPFIVRLEQGYIDRDQYAIAALYQPGKPWTATRPQRQFNGKLLITHGFACGVAYQTGTAPSVTEGTAVVALGRGFATMSNALDHSGHNCNIAVQAESLVMTKAHLIDNYGALRYTIGVGCSGGSLAVQWISNAYPGIYQGILPSCSFPDAWSTATQFLDYHQTLRYFKNPTLWGAGVAWTPTQMGDVEGGPDGVVNAQVSDAAQFHVVIPTDPCAGVSDQQRYDPTTNPGGVRCTIQDAAINVFGPRPRSEWTPQEQQIGHGFAATPVDNVGVQYGLGAVQKGQITPAQFVDLNKKVGGLDPDANYTARRTRANHSALRNAYRSGMINETNNLNRTAIIDCRGPNPGLFHDAYRAFAVRARLDRAHGGHGNQLIWEGPVNLSADTQCELNSFLAMDRWLTGVETDRSKAPLARKIVRDNPGLTDRCYDGNGRKLSDGLCPAGVVNVEGTPRTVAGDSITTDANKCQLKPLDRNADYGPLPFTDAQWNKLKAVFPRGVCDYSKPGVEQQGTIPWQTYQNSHGDAIYGGKPLGPAPKSNGFKVKRR